MPRWGENQQWQKRFVNAFAQILGLFMCFLRCIALWKAGEIANQKYFHLFETKAGTSWPFDVMIEFTVLGSVFFAAGCGLIYLGARERRKLQPVAIEVPDDPN